MIALILVIQSLIFGFLYRSYRCCLYNGYPSQDWEECPLLPLCLVLRCHWIHRVHHHRIRPWGMENPILWSRSLDAHVDRCPRHCRPNLPYEGPADRKGRTRGPDEDCGCGAGVHLPVHIL